MGEKYTALLERLQDVKNLENAGAILDWDMNTKMPPQGAEARGAQLSTISKIHHELFTADETLALLEAAAEELADADPDSDEARMIQVVRKDFDDARKLPAKFVAEFSALTVKAHQSWAEARANNNFAHFLPDLERIVEMSQQKAEYLGYDAHRYDALLQEFEPSLTTADVKGIFDGHKAQLIDLIQAVSEVADRVDDAPVHQAFDVVKQREFGEMVAAAIGYDFTRGRLDESVHPFSTSFSKNDSRITTRYDANWLNPALFGTMHECGHSMYEQGVGDSLDGTLLGNGTSLSVHESQSRTWENMVGRSKNFWHWAYPKLQAQFPGQFDDISLDDFYKAINKVSPSYIRVEADEATYNLHIMLRFEIEQKIIGGEVAVKDIPAMWNSMFNDFLGITPPNDSEGCLQDIHWSMGGFGYFSTYALGNLLGAQYYNQALKDAPSIPDDIRAGNFATLLKWQNANIHQHGRKFNTKELTQRITGEGINSQPYIDYLVAKFSDVYGL